MLKFNGFTITDYPRRSLVILGGTIIFLWVITSIHFGGITRLPGAHLEQSTTPRPPKFAYATIITGEGDAEYPDVEDPYLWATRLLTFQLLHNPHTRGNASDIPLLVLVTPDIPQRHRDILTNDGATVIPVESLQREWIHPKWGRWGDVLAKLNLWRLEEYDKIAFLDADSVLFRPIDGIFNLASTDILRSTNGTNETVIANLPPAVLSRMPSEYMLAGIHDLWMEQFNEPPAEELFFESHNYLNAGFFVLHPSLSVYNYYVSLLDTPNLFSSAYPEQNLLNCAHRTDGPMPWKELGHGWNSKFGRESDYNNGLRSIHQKWWRASYEQFLDDRVTESLQEMRNYLATRNQTQTA